VIAVGVYYNVMICLFYVHVWDLVVSGDGRDMCHFTTEIMSLCPDDHGIPQIEDPYLVLHDNAIPCLQAKNQLPNIALSFPSLTARYKTSTGIPSKYQVRSAT
jgi:hypothetical protein